MSDTEDNLVETVARALWALHDTAPLERALPAVQAAHRKYALAAIAAVREHDRAAEEAAGAFNIANCPECGKFREHGHECGGGGVTAV